MIAGGPKCSQFFYNCLGVPASQTGYLTKCGSGTFFDTQYPGFEAQGGNCNYKQQTPACGGQEQPAQQKQPRRLAQANPLPPTIPCTTSLLVAVADAVQDPSYACSPYYYNCLGAQGQLGQLMTCPDSLMFDKTYMVRTPQFPDGQGGACNYMAQTPSCPTK